MTSKMPELNTTKALERVIVEMLTDHTELFKQFMDNQSFKEMVGGYHIQ